jgi:hypothetical protein
MVMDILVKDSASTAKLEALGALVAALQTSPRPKRGERAIGKPRPTLSRSRTRRVRTEASEEPGSRHWSTVTLLGWVNQTTAKGRLCVVLSSQKPSATA